MSKKGTIIGLILILLLLSIVIAQNNTVSVYLFYGRGCPHCSRTIAFFDQLKENYPNLNLIKKEVYFNDENRHLFEKFSSLYNAEIEGVPTIFIDKKRFVGFNTEISKTIEYEIQRCSAEICEDLSKIECSVQSNSSLTGIDAQSHVHMNQNTYDFIGWAFLVVIFLLIMVLIAKKLRGGKK